VCARFPEIMEYYCVEEFGTKFVQGYGTCLVNGRN
jgi:hypothetical protein